MIELITDLAIEYRKVGGFVGLGPNMTFLTRVRFMVAVGCFMAFLAVVHHEAWQQTLAVFALCGVGAFLSRDVPHAVFQAKASLVNGIAMSIIGVVSLALVVAPYSVLNWSFVLTHPIEVFSNHSLVVFSVHRMLLCLFGLFMGPAYYVGWKYLNNIDSGIYYRNRPAQWAIASRPVVNGLVLLKEEYLDQAAVGGSEWGELLTGELCWKLMWIAALVLA